MKNRNKAGLLILVFTMFLMPAISQGVGSNVEFEIKKDQIPVGLSLLNESQHSLESAFKYFAETQEPNGSWNYDPAVTSLVLYSFMFEPTYVPDKDTAEMLKKGYNFLKQYVKPNGGIYDKQYRNYSTSVALLAFTAARNPEYKQIIDNAHEFLVEFQLDEGEDISPDHAFYGGIGYGGDDRPDLSNTQLALDAIKAAEQFQVTPDGKVKIVEDNKKERLEPHWQKALVFLARTQNLKEVNKMDYAEDDGGFIYETGHYTPDRSISYGSMTFAGLKSLMLAGIDKDDIRVKAAYAWIRDNYTVDENPNFGTTSLYYYFMTATKCLAAFGGDTLVDSEGKTHYWREDFIKKIISLQHGEGYWVNPNGRYQENIKNLATAYSVIAIKYSLLGTRYNKPEKSILSN